jgi:hypothetical protein
LNKTAWSAASFRRQTILQYSAASSVSYILGVGLLRRLHQFLSSQRRVGLITLRVVTSTPPPSAAVAAPFKLMPVTPFT